MTEGLAEEAKAERGHRGTAPISLLYPYIENQS